MIIIVLSFILIWLGTTFFIVRYVKKLKDDLLGRFSDKEKPPEEKDENILEEDEERVLILRPFEFIGRVDPKGLSRFIQREHPQVIALVLAYLEPDKASLVLQNLPLELQSEVSRRIATLDHVSSEVICEIERVLEKKLSSGKCDLPINCVKVEFAAAGGVESVVEILNRVNLNSKDQIIRGLEDEDPELAEELKKRSITLRNHCGKYFKKLRGKSKTAVTVNGEIND